MIEDKKLSNLSNIPPCPGINSLEFFKLFFLLKNDSIKSPKKANKIMNAIYKVNSTSIGILKIFANKIVKQNDDNIPPINPSIVLFGLTLINLFFPKNLPII